MQQEARHIFHLGLTKNFPRSYANYKSRSISLILIIHVYKCMQIKKVFRLSNNKNILRSLHSLEENLHVYIWRFLRDRWFDFNDFPCMLVYACACINI